jgi:hypothetical protein
VIPPLLIDAFAGYRLTKLVTSDVITSGIRDRFIAHAYARAHRSDTPAEGETWTDQAMEDRQAPKPATLFTCRWCAGMWIAFGVVAARRAAPKVWEPVADALAISAAAALLANLED